MENLFILVSTNPHHDINPYLRHMEGYEPVRTPILAHAHFFAEKKLAENFIRLYDLKESFKSVKLVVNFEE